MKVNGIITTSISKIDGKSLASMSKISGVTVVSYLPAAQTYFNQVVTNGGSLTSTEKTYINTFIGALGSDFTEFDRLWIFGLSNSIAARTSIANPTSTIITAVNGITFTANQGFQIVTGAQYLNTNFNPKIQGVKYIQNNASYGIYSRTNSQGTFSDMGSFNGISFILLQARRESSALFNLALNDNSFIGLATANSLGLFAGSRISGTRRLIKNGSVLASDTYSTNGIPSLNVYICGYNSSGSAVITSARQYSACFFGSGAINQSNFYTSLQALATSIGWAV
jgi:hypothetical protein